MTLGSADPLSADAPFWCGIALNSSPGDYLGDSAFTDVTAYLADHSTKRGRQFDLDRIEAGTADILFRNQDGELDPANTAGSYYPNLKPLRRIRLFRHEGGVRYPMFDGLIERWNPSWVVGRNSTTGDLGYQDMRVQAVDQFEVFNNQQLLDANYAALTTSLTGTNNDLTYTSRLPGGSSISITYVDGGVDNAGETVSVSGSDISVDLYRTGSAIASTGSRIITAIQASAAANALVTVALATANTGAGLVTALAQTFLSGSGWASERSGARIGRELDRIGWSSSARAIDTGLYDLIAVEYSYSNGPSALGGIQDAADSELGYVFMDGGGNIVFHDGDHRLITTASTISQATFSDDGTGYPFHGIQQSYDKDRIVNDVTVTGGLSTSIAQNVTDSTSQSTYLRRSQSRTSLLQNDASALAIATSIVNAYKTPAQRFESITLVDLGASGWNDAVLAREIGDRITVRTNPPGHTTTIQYDCFIDGIEHHRTVGMPHTVVFQLTPISSSASGGGGGGGAEGAVLDSSGDTFVLDSGVAGILG